MTTTPKTGAEFYRDTVFLPKTSFPMRGDLPTREPIWQEKWAKMDVYKTLRDRSKGREKFVLHIGPPFANGGMHLGHAFNNTLKDTINKSWQMMGYDAPMVMGWDCHGLPIEWKIEEQYRANGKNREDVDPVSFRAECRTFAQKWVNVQSSDLQRMGIVGDFKNPYLTMSKHAEARISGVIHHFARTGALYRGVKPVMWSVVEKTALADAETEYKDHKSITVWVRFPVLQTGPRAAALTGASVVIWTTTPWTLPSNRAIAFGPDMDYAVYTVREVAEDARVVVGDKLVLCTKLSADVKEKAKITAWEESAPFKGADIVGTICAHPLRGQGYDFDVPALPADFVVDDTGTGFVHIAPAHGMDDFFLGQKHGIEVTDNVDDAGVFRDHVPLFAGKPVFTDKGEMGDANFSVLKALDEAGALIAKGTLRHEYPHSWRSKAPLIYRTTPQWFVSMETNDLRQKALQGIADTIFHPAEGANRIGSMIAHRPDWCISRQRLWGTPIAIFVNKKTGEILKDESVFERIIQIFESEGADAWWARPASDFLGADYRPDDYEQIMDTADVWMDSGSTHTFVLQDRPELKFPADLYLEGSDQHRGWFHTSLLVSSSLTGRAPYRHVLTHGFILDEKGYKLSKSLGNYIGIEDLLKQYGADIVRLWAMSSDYSDDVRVGKAILDTTSDMYRRIRNTLRFLLGALDGFDAAERVTDTDLSRAPELERLILHWLTEIGADLRTAIKNYDYVRYVQRLHNFCAVELSAFYFDIRKDRLYCDRPDLFDRRAARTVMAMILQHLCTWLAPILSFTADEAWEARPATIAPESQTVHTESFPDVRAEWTDAALAARWDKIRAIRRVITGALEPKRADKTIGSSLEAAPTLYLSPALATEMADVDWAEIAITSQVFVKTEDPPAEAFTLADVPEVAVVFDKAPGQKCQRCWKILPSVGSDPDYPDISPRDADAVRHYISHTQAAA